MQPLNDFDMWRDLGLDWGGDMYSEMDEILQRLSRGDEPLEHVINREIRNVAQEEDKLIRYLVLEERRVDVLAEYVLDSGDGKFTPAAHHKSMIQWQDLNQKGLLLAGRGMAKSQYCTIARIILEILCNPNIRILLVSDSIGQSQDFLRGIKAQFEHNLKLKRIFGDYMTDAPIWAESRITVPQRTQHSKEPTVTCAGLKTSLPGRHFDLIIADDIVTDKNALSETERERVKRYYYNTLEPTLEHPHGRMYVIGTRWHRDDFYGWLLKMEFPHSHLIIGVLDERDGETVPVWPEKFSLEAMLKRRDAHYESFQLQYQCVAPEGMGAVFHEKMFVVDAMDTVWPADVRRWQGADLAIGQKSHHDPYAHTTLDIQRNTAIPFLQDFETGRKTFPEQVQHIKTMFERHPSTIGVVLESNAYQAALSQQVRREFPHIPVIRHYTTVDKMTRAQQMAILLSNTPLHIRNTRAHMDFKALLLGFPHEKGSKDAFDAFSITYERGVRGRRKSQRHSDDVGLI